MHNLSDLLFSGRMAPGDKLSLRQAADVLGVSIMPVREAVSRLVADKALEVTPNRAIRVPLMTAAQFRDSDAGTHCNRRTRCRHRRPDTHR